MKKLISILISISLVLGIAPVGAYARDDKGKIDLYEVFSNTADKMKNEVGSRIYKWSMHLPDDAVVYKTDRVNSFNMSTKSYQASVDLEINKNKDEITLEEMLYKIQNGSQMRNNSFERRDNEFSVNIATDGRGEKYIRTIKSNRVFDFFMMDESADEMKDYVENRIYIANNNIYNLTIRMDGGFYKQHDEMFDKLVSSFKLSFDEYNQYIKELSDSVSVAREYKNTTYGWRITMSPYWKVEGDSNARFQTLRPVYSDEELNEDKNNKKDNANEFKVPEGITVSLVSSAQSDEDASKWAEKDTILLKNNYNSDVYEILRNEAEKQGDKNVQHVIIRYNTVTKNPYIVHNIYVIGNGYKYLVSGTIAEGKYKNNNEKKGFEDMLNSFKLDRGCISKYLGKIVSPETVLNFNDLKTLKMKKYNFQTKVTKIWNTSSDRDDFYMQFGGRFFYNPMDSLDRDNISNDEYINGFDSTSNMLLSMSAGLNANEINKIIADNVEAYKNNDEVRMSLAKVNIQSSSYNGTEIYCIQKEYDLNAIKKFVNEDANKIYDLEKLKNEYQYIVKIGKDTYIESINISVANMTPNNKEKINEIWQNTFINKINYSKLNLKWTQHKLQEFNKN